MSISTVVRCVTPMRARRADAGLRDNDHKSQGSEYPAVVIPVVTQHYTMLQRNLLYTGLTRGRRLVVLVGQRKAVGIAVRGVQGRRRWSKLKELLAMDERSLPAGNLIDAAPFCVAMADCVRPAHPHRGRHISVEQQKPWVAGVCMWISTCVGVFGRCRAAATS